MVHLHGDSTETILKTSALSETGEHFCPLVQVVCHQPFAAEGQFDPWPDHVRSVEDEGAMGELFLRSLLFSPVTIITLKFQTHLHLNATLTGRTKWRKHGSLHKAVLFRISESRKYLR